MSALVLIAAIAQNGVIGRDNRLLWRLKSDLKHFRTLTMGHPVIMGRKTFESIGKPLPGRSNIIVTSQSDFAPEGVHIAHSFEEARKIGARIAQESGLDAVFVAGGGQIYQALMPQADRLEITLVDLAPEGDAYFPEISREHWAIEARVDHPKGLEDEAAFSFLRYQRR
jgi:dihydrofolate reductase